MGRQNGTTIEDMMNMECMKNSKVIAGFRGVRNTISKINVMADPDILNWVDEGELLLTTAYSLKKDNVEEQKSLIKECSRKKLAGIGIKISPYLESLSQEVLDLADTLSFPIIDLYYATPFSDIMTPVFKEIFNKQAYLLQRMEIIHEQLMNAMLKGADINHIADVINENLKNPVLINLEFPNKTYTEFNSVDEPIREILYKNYEKFYEQTPEKSIIKRFDESNELINGKYVKRMVMPIVVKDTIYGHIFTWAMNTPLGGFDMSVLENASTIMALEILKKLSIKEVENRYRTEFLEDLFSLDERRKGKAIERSPFFNISNKDKYAAIVISLKKANGDNAEASANIIQNQITKVLNSAEKSISKLKLNGIVGSRTDSILILLSFKKELGVDKSLKEFTDQIETIISEKQEYGSFWVGIGRIYEGLQNVYKSYVDAHKAISTGRILDEKPIVNFEDLGIYKILNQNQIGEELEKFYNTTVKTLVDYDEKKSTELVKTLEAYFEHNGNLKKMSDALFTHYNTILYRVQRINEITGMGLEDPNHRLNLEIALKIKKLLKK